MTNGFMSIETTAKWCDVSPRTIKRWIGQGLPVFQSGPRSKVLIRPGDIEIFLTKRQVAKPDLDAMVASVISGLQ